MDGSESVSSDLQLGRYGIWSGELRSADAGAAAQAAAELEELGFGALWLPGRGAGVFERVDALLAATQRVPVATGIVSVWQHDAAEVAAGFTRLEETHPGRFLLGIGVSHAPMVDRDEPGRYRRPLERLSRFLDELDAAPIPVPVGRRVLASLRPRSLALAASRSAGSHPYLTPVAHTRWARGLIGEGRLLAPEQGVVLDLDPVRGRRLAREFLTRYLQLPNYVNNLRSLGYTGEDFQDGGSDRLVDEVMVVGDAGRALERAQAHLDAGADHVCFQVIQEHGAGLPLEEWRALARAAVAA